MGKNGKTYTSEFKNEAVKLSYNSDKSISEVADSLGISRSSLYRWRAEFTADHPNQAFPNRGQGKEQDAEIIRRGMDASEQSELEKQIQNLNAELIRVKETLQAEIAEQGRAEEESEASVEGKVAVLQKAMNRESNAQNIAGQLIPSAGGHIAEQKTFNYGQDDFNVDINDFVRIDQVITTVLKWWWLLILAAIVAASIGYGVSQRLPPVYQATTTVLVGQPFLATDLDSRDIQTSELLAVTYADIAQREPVLQGTVEALGLDDNWQQLRKRVKVALVDGTQLLEVTVEAKSPNEAQMIANEIAHQMILLSPTAPQDQESEGTISFEQQRLDSLRNQIENGQRRIEALDRTMATATTAAEMSALQDEINTLEGLIVNWEANYVQLLNFVKNEKPVNYLTVIEEAHARPTPVRPFVQLNTLLASVVGLFLALALIFTLEYLDDSIKSADDLNRVLNLTPLGAVGQMNGRDPQDRLIPSQGFLSPVSEAYRMIRTNLQFMSVDRACNAIMISSAAIEEGKSTTVANLGIVMAQAGFETIIVDADLRRPTQHRIFQLRTQKGLTDLIRWPELNIAHHLFTTDVAHLRVLASGSLPPNPSEILGSRRMEYLLAKLKEMADVVILDSPPVVAFTDAAVLSNSVDGVVLVIKAGQTQRDIVKSAVLILQQAGANFLGAVLNGVSTKQVPNYYGRYYSLYNTDEPSRLPVTVRLVNGLKRLPFFKLPAFRGKSGINQLKSNPPDVNV